MLTTQLQMPVLNNFLFNWWTFLFICWILSFKCLYCI